MKRQSLLLLFTFVVASSAHATLPSTVALDSSTNAEFLAIGKPSALKIRGKLSPGNLSGSLKLDGGKLSGTAKAKMDGFDTGITLRNEHMKEKYLETAKFPEATFALETTELPAAVARGAGEGTVPFRGTMNLHGVAQPIEGTLEAKSGDGQLKLVFTFPVELEKFGIVTPAYLGIKITDKVNVTVEANARTSGAG